MQLKGNYVMVKQLEEEKKSQGGIILPDVAVKEGTTGKVVAMGDGIYVENFVKDEASGEYRWQYVKRPIDENIKVGATVIYPRWAGQELEINGEKYLLLKEYDILAVIE